MHAQIILYYFSRQNVIFKITLNRTHMNFITLWVSGPSRNYYVWNIEASSCIAF